ncbi:selenium cofactor biosynthesis protein YqeC [Halomarina oriensis]|uniref:Putative selenium-dependent hydroxylase accessory protein YqeC n=1 Tax=Halomarina oriensis TaxID=671145 RepID=A0A6B0GUF1_9EURY|nr:selenium cofactor biosynthesis protein YqeC [Halomarina oriensis]MWG35348.1 putative selenium-dependent hydroxylase accessory protein YqeC [Halomarina oriensis]
MDLSEALGATREDDRTPVVSVVGAGGKKTTLWTLADRLPAIVTASVRIPIFDDKMAVAVTPDPVAALDEHDDRPLGLVPERAAPDDPRYAGYENETVDAIAANVDDPVLVKADGARNREFKAPDEHEPQLPSSTTSVVALASVQVVGKPLTEEHVHRPELVADLADLAVGDTVEPIHVARVLASERGGRKDIPPNARVVPTLNKVDDEEWAAVARDVADAVHDRCSVPYVASTCLREGRLVETV